MLESTPSASLLILMIMLLMSINDHLGPHTVDRFACSYNTKLIMAANSGVSDRVFQRHGRWKSAQSKDMYVDDDLDQRLSVSKFLGL